MEAIKPNTPLKLTEYKTQNGNFFCSSEVDKKMVSNFIEKNGHSVDEIDCLSLFLNRNSIVIDVGGHIGTFSVPLSKKVSSVFTFEPNPTNFNLLKKNLNHNDVTNVTIINKPVAESTKQIELIEQPVSGQSYIKEGLGTTTTTIDYLGVRPDLIKMDIEGYELKALQGSEHTLINKPVLYIEYALWCLRRAGNTTRELNTFLKNHGYATYLHLGDKRFVKLPNLALIISKNATNNILCIDHNSILPKELETVSLFKYFADKFLNKFKFSVRKFID